ncbi:7882_t:CDS:2 [Cetraspora pellucida]|uniref:7882_t:CDS:1 n=1 Tax=Cetraspora pellucida TaxID=1433469 RepID=A0ACA9KDG4_9GLOM|nr:7882_t:CDS:2 [Cetraspora pellucida]
MSQEKLNLTPEQKEANKDYILANLDKYIIDNRRFFYHIEKDFYGEYGYIGPGAVNDYQEVKEKVIDRILKDKSRKQKKANKNNASAPQPNEQISPPQTPLPPTNSQTEKEQANQEHKKTKKQSEQQSQAQTNNSPTENPNPPKTENQSIPTNPEPPHQSPTPPNNNETSNPLPTPETIQNHYNQDKDKSLVENNSTDEEQKQANQELLNLIITAELLIKDNQFNPDTLSQLLKEKEQNTEAYQLLNKEGRIEQTINKLTNLQEKQNKNNDSVVNNNKSDISPIKIFTIIGIIGVIIMSSLVVFKKAKKRKRKGT